MDGSSIHCHLWNGTKVIRNNCSRFYVAEDVFLEDTFHLCCSGRAVIIDLDVLKELYLVSKYAQSFAPDDAYITGQLAQASGVGHVDIASKVDWDPSDKTDCMLSGKLLFTHEYSIYGATVEHMAQ